MADRRNSQRLLVAPESLEHIDFTAASEPQSDVTEDTQPMRLSFLALLADRDPVVQMRLERRRTLALEEDLEELQDDENNRPTDPMVMTGG